MKITVEFESLEEFNAHFGNTSGANSPSYKPGEDDVGGKLHKDIKDIDDVSSDYDTALFAHATALFNLYLEKGNNATLLKKKVKEVVGDYEIRTGLSDSAYEQLIWAISDLCHFSDIHEYRNINKAFDQ